MFDINSKLLETGLVFTNQYSSAANETDMAMAAIDAAIDVVGILYQPKTQLSVQCAPTQIIDRNSPKIR
jgi:hypothetical protein